MKTFIYTLRCPIKNDIIYVGSTCNMELRLKNHISQSMISNSNMSMYIRKYKIVPIIEVLEVVTHKKYLQVENYWIEQLRQWGFTLLNSAHNKNRVKLKYKKVKQKYSSVRISDKVYKQVKIFCDERGYKIGEFCCRAAIEKLNEPTLNY